MTYSLLMGEYDAETKTFSAFAGTVSGMASPFTPPNDATLVGLRVVPNADAATTLMEHVVLEFTCAKWTPNTIEIGAQGMGLLTVPTQGRGPIIDWPINQPVAAGVPIKMRGKNVTADTPVGVSVLVYGIFE